jgi:hypothetical protein
VRVSTREIGARGAVVGHEQRVADEDGIRDPVTDARRGVAGRMDDRDLELADREALAILEELIKR